MAHSAAPGPEPEPDTRPPGRVIRGPWPTVPPEPTPPLAPCSLEDLPPARPTVRVQPAPRVHCRAHWSSSPTAGYFLILGTILAAVIVGLILRATVFAPVAVG